MALEVDVRLIVSFPERAVNGPFPVATNEIVRESRYVGFGVGVAVWIGIGTLEGAAVFNMGFVDCLEIGEVVGLGKRDSMGAVVGEGVIGTTDCATLKGLILAKKMEIVEKILSRIFFIF